MSTGKANQVALVSRPEADLPARRESTFLGGLPTWLLAPAVVGIFALLLANLIVVDPLPFVDEAAMILALVQGLRALAARRRHDVSSRPGQPTARSLEAAWQAGPSGPPALVGKAS